MNATMISFRSKVHQSYFFTLWSEGWISQQITQGIFNIVGPYIFADILDFKNLQEKVVTYQINTVIHFSALLSAIGEHNTPLAMRVNIEGLHNILEVSRQYKLKLFVPSTIGKYYNVVLM